MMLGLFIAAALQAATPTAADKANYEKAIVEYFGELLYSARLAGLCEGKDTSGYLEEVRATMEGPRFDSGDLQLEARGQIADGRSEARKTKPSVAQCKRMIASHRSSLNLKQAEYEAMKRGWERMGYELP